MTNPDAETAAGPPTAEVGPGFGLRGVARGGALNLAGAAVTAIVNLATTLAIARELSKGGAGTFFAATSLFLLIESLVVSGASTGLVYFIARARAVGKFSDVRMSLRLAFVPVLLGSAVVVALSPWWANAFARVLTGATTTGGGLILLMCALPLAATSDMALAATTGYRTMRPTVVVERIGRPLLQLVAVLAVLQAHDPVLLAFAWVVPYSVSFAVALLWLRRLIARDDHLIDSTGPDPGRPGGAAADKGPLTLGRFWAYTGPRGVASVAQTAMQRLDIVLVGVLAGPKAAALYTVATRFLVVGQLLATSIGNSVQPRLAGWFARGNIAAVRHSYQTATAWVILLSWPFYLGTAWLAPYWLEVFGRGYGAATDVVVVLSASMLLGTGCGMVSVVLVMGGRTFDNLLNTVVALVVNVGLDILLIPHLGIMGAAIGWAAAITANNLMPLVQVWRGLHVHPFGRSTLLAAALSSVALGLVPLVAVLAGGTRLLPTVIGCAVGSAVWLAGVIWFRGVFELEAFRPGRPRVHRRPVGYRAEPSGERPVSASPDEPDGRADRTVEGRHARRTSARNQRRSREHEEDPLPSRSSGD
jgi:O-antigen/teichoic acid export membrane protein